MAFLVFAPLAFGYDSAGHFARNALYFAFEVAYASFLGVVADDVEQAFIGEGEIACPCRPVASRWRLTRKRLAICSFSCSV